ncbi:proline utilization trans-activator [Diutina catenulata]
MNEEPPASGEPIGKQKRTNVACIRCRSRHIRCPGGDPCKKCSLARAKCEYVEGEKKIVVSMKYLSRLHDDIARLKKENAGLRHQLQESPQHTTPGAPAKPEPPEVIDPHQGEVITPSLDKHGRMIESRTGEKLYVGSSSMTLFGLEIQNMASESPLASLPSPAPPTASPEARRETAILEMEGNAYKITLEKTNTRPGLSINFTLPSYSYAMLLVDTFINYNDGCFYFFNEGLVKRFLMNLYSGKTRDNHAILKRNAAADDSPDDDTILETIWFCKILLIFAIGEMYLGTESDSHLQAKRDKKDKKSTLPGAGFFYQASELFTGLFASGAIDNITKDGGIEVMLLYAFYLQVADCTVASYFYFGLALRSTLILGWHVDADKENLNRFELEHRRRIWWTVYMYERMLSSKAGLPLSFADDSVSTELPFDFHADPVDDSDVRSCYIFPPADYINNCVTITQINAIILSSLYTKQPTVNILPVVTDLVQRLVNWKVNLPAYLRVDFSADNLRVSRLVVNLMTEYFQGINLAVRPLLFHFATKKLKESQQLHRENRYIDLTKFSKNVLSLLNSSFQASINTIKSIWALVPENMVALFGWMDREYLFTSASTLILFNASFGVHEATKEHLDHALIIFTKMKKLGNYPAALRRAQLLKLIKVLDFNGNTQDLIQKHDDVSEAPAPVPAEFDVFKPDVDDVPMIDMPPSYASDLAGIEGVTFPDEESRLWNEITNDASWLNVADADLASQSLSQQHPTNSRSFSGFSPAAFGYSDIINSEFHDIM